MAQSAANVHRTGRVSWLAWSLCVIIAVATLISAGGDLLTQGSEGGVLKQAANVLWGLFPLAFAILAALILSRQPRHAVGWLLMIPALIAVPSALLSPRDLQHVTTAPASPSLTFLLAVWIDNWTWTQLIFPILLVPLLFPSGRPPSARWRFVIVYAAVMWASFVFIITFSQRFTHTNAAVAW